MDEPVVGTRPQFAAAMGGFGERKDGTVDFGADRVTVDGTTGDLQFAGVVAGQIRADWRPALAFVGGFENNIAGSVEHIRVVW